MSTPRKRLRVFFVVYLIFVVYGSLVPLAFNALPLESAWERFLDTPWLNLGPGSRADWVANILLYIPLSGALFLLISQNGARSVLLSAIATLLFCMALALTVEFLQVFFPPRTVSLNDLLAELIGTTIGITATAWAVTRAWRPTYQIGSLPPFEVLLWVYALGYLALSFFPFDFIVSAEELRTRLESDYVGLFVASAGCDQLYRCTLKLLLEILLVVPIGILVAARQGVHGSISAISILLWGMGIGAGIELLQVLILSGISQGVSVVTKAIGVVLGSYLYGRRETVLLFLVHTDRVRFIAALGIPYLLGLLAVNQWFHSEWVSFADALDKIGDLFLLAFYYHYYTTETVALTSLLLNAGLYSPLGLAAAFLGNNARQPRVSLAMVLVFVLALVIEAAKLFQFGQRPDPTNVLIAIVSAVATQLIAFRLFSIMLSPYGGLQLRSSRSSGLDS